MHGAACLSFCAHDVQLHSCALEHPCMHACMLTTHNVHACRLCTSAADAALHPIGGSCWLLRRTCSSAGAASRACAAAVAARCVVGCNVWGESNHQHVQEAPAVLSLEMHDCQGAQSWIEHTHAIQPDRGTDTELLSAAVVAHSLSHQPAHARCAHACMHDGPAAGHIRTAIT